MHVQRFLFLATVVAAMQSAPEAAWSQALIACDDTKISSYDGRHGAVYFTFHAETGENYSFLTESGSSSVMIFIGRETFSSASSRGPRAWFCNWTASETGDYMVVLDIDGPEGGWRVSLTMFCGSAPAECSDVSVAPATWTLVKALFR